MQIRTLQPENVCIHFRPCQTRSTEHPNIEALVKNTQTQAHVSGIYNTDGAPRGWETFFGERGEFRGQPV